MPNQRAEKPRGERQRPAAKQRRGYPSLLEELLLLCRHQAVLPVWPDHVPMPSFR